MRDSKQQQQQHQQQRQQQQHQQQQQQHAKLTAAAYLRRAVRAQKEERRRVACVDQVTALLALSCLPFGLANRAPRFVRRRPSRLCLFAAFQAPKEAPIDQSAGAFARARRKNGRPLSCSRRPAHLSRVVERSRLEALSYASLAYKHSNTHTSALEACAPAGRLN